MKTLTSVGGVRVYGKSEDAWAVEEGRQIASFPAMFDSDVYTPDIVARKGHSAYFVLPCHRGKTDYAIHLLDTGEAIVIKEGRLYLCTLHEGTPQVIEFDAISAHRVAASSL